jgi:arylformamidase
MSWRDLSRTELDREYFIRGTVPNVSLFTDAYRTRTDAAKRALAWKREAFGPTEPERLDIYPAASLTPAPVFVFVHGGYWRALDADDSGYMAPALSALGVVTVAVNYALCPGVTLAEIVRQCEAALDWVFANIARFGGDPARVHVGGSSAGGHLAAMLARDPRVASATLLSGLYDLEPVQASEPNDWLRLTPEEARALSPAHLPLPRAGMPLLFAVAPTETREFLRQTWEHAARCAAGGSDVIAIPGTPGGNHFDLPFELGDPAMPLYAALRRVLGV